MIWRSDLMRAYKSNQPNYVIQSRNKLKFIYKKKKCINYEIELSYGLSYIFRDR